MPTPTLPGFFPGNASLLQHAKILVSDDGFAALRSQVNHELGMMNQPDDIWIGNLRHRYGADPLVMALLDKYEAVATRHNVTRTPPATDELQPWPMA